MSESEWITISDFTSACPSACTSVRTSLFHFLPISAIVSQNVTNESCLTCVKRKKYVVWVTLGEAKLRILKLTLVFHHLPRLGPKQLCALAHLRCTYKVVLPSKYNSDFEVGEDVLDIATSSSKLLCCKKWKILNIFPDLPWLLIGCQTTMPSPCSGFEINVFIIIIIKKSYKIFFEYVHWSTKIYWILTESLRNSTTVTSLPNTALRRSKQLFTAHQTWLWGSSMNDFICSNGRNSS